MAAVIKYNQITFPFFRLFDRLHVKFFISTFELKTLLEIIILPLITLNDCSLLPPQKATISLHIHLLLIHIHASVCRICVCACKMHALTECL